MGLAPGSGAQTNVCLTLPETLLGVVTEVKDTRRGMSEQSVLVLEYLLSHPDRSLGSCWGHGTQSQSSPGLCGAALEAFRCLRGARRFPREEEFGIF